MYVTAFPDPRDERSQLGIETTLSSTSHSIVAYAHEQIRRAQET